MSGTEGSGRHDAGVSGSRGPGVSGTSSAGGSGRRGRGLPRAVVVGGGMAGLLAAAALYPYADVTVVERDTPPDGPEARRGVPQARHVHLLWSGGARAMEGLLPGVTAAWVAAGAHRIALPTGLVSYSAQGWLRRWPEMEFTVSCTRDLLEWVVRERVLALPGVELLPDTGLLGLRGSSSRVTGVRVRPGDGGERELPAALVVDASGRGSRATAWLAGLGVPEAPGAEVDSGLVYASRLFRAPQGAEDIPVVNVQPDADDPVPAQSATIAPVEGGRWLVTLSGTRGGEPTGVADEFEPFARGVRHPVVGELIARAEPLTDVVLTRSTVNRRHFFEKVAAWPEGFVAIGDAVATYNPLYGHGMSVAAQGAVALGEAAAGPGVDAPGLARHVQRAVAAPVTLAWDLATGTDIHYPGAVGARPGRAQELLRRYATRTALTATGRPLVMKAFLGVMTLSRPVTDLLAPEVALAVLRGPLTPPLTGPPFTARERAVLLGSS